MRKVWPIKESEVFIMMISCGMPPENFQIALSPRYTLDEILVMNNAINCKNENLYSYIYHSTPITEVFYRLMPFNRY
jgi:hypothetical protein